MITPLMHILSSLDENYNVDVPVNILYLSKNDRDLIINEATIMGNMLWDDNQIWMDTSPTGQKVVGEVQVVAGESVSFSPYTVMLLTRVRQCFEKYKRESVAEEVEDSNLDLSNDSIVLRLEGNPKYIYVVVYNLMSMPSLRYEEKIQQLQDLLNVLQVHTTIVDVPKDSVEQGRLARLELHSNRNYWKKMLMGDYIRAFGEVPPEFTDETIHTIRKELSYLGMYGFVDPLAMYQEFSNARVSRKVMVHVDDSVIEFLQKVVRSGGGSV